MWQPAQFVVRWFSSLRGNNSLINRGASVSLRVWAA